MTITDMLPGLDTAALSTVRENAVRLIGGNNPKRKAQAEAALELIDAEIARRQAELPPAKPAKARRTKKVAA